MTTRPTLLPTSEDDRRWTVAEAIVRCLAEWGVGAVYGVSGANIEHLHDAIHVHGTGRLRSVAARSEMGAAFMADAQARVHGALGVCCSTSGGGMMNLAVGIAESYQDGVPVLAIVGQVARTQEGRGGFQDSSGRAQTVDALGLWSSITKEVRRIRSGATLWQDLLGAVRACISGRPGPSALLIPRDVFDERVPPRPGNWPTSLSDVTAPREAATDDVDKLASALRQAQRPVLVMGSGVRTCSAPEAVVVLAREGAIPAVSTLADIGAFPHDDGLYLGAIGTAGHASAHRYLNEEADLLVVLGSRLEMMLSAPIQKALSRCTVYFVDQDTSSLAERFPDAQLVEGEIGGTIERLLNHHPWRRLSGGGRPGGYELTRYPAMLVPPPPHEEDTGEEADGSLLQSEAITALQGALPPGGHVLFDAGNCAASSLHYLTLPQDSSSTIALGMGGMGYAIPAAVGVQLCSAPGTRTTVLCGDGAFLLMGMEVHTAVDMGLPILFVVFNNGQHGMCVTRQQLYFESRIECSRYARASIAQIARGFGDEEQLWVGSASTLQDLESALAELSQRPVAGPAVLELVIHREEMPPFTPFIEGSQGAAQPRPEATAPPQRRRAQAA